LGDANRHPALASNNNYMTLCLNFRVARSLDRNAN
jgi:hypothetical protein